VMKKFRINESGDAELRLDDKHTLIVHAADEGIVLDVWEDGEGQSLKKNPSDQKDTKTPMELTEDYLVHQARHRAKRTMLMASTNDYASANMEQMMLKAYIKTLNWMKLQGYISRWEKTTPQEYKNKLRSE
jgi:protein required for attachment to host cells